MTSAAIIPDDHMRDLLSPIQPGMVVPSADLWARYVRLMADTGQVAANRQALGRALTRVGCDRRRVRKSRGRRGKQRVKETHCWVIPGAPPVDEETVRIRMMIERLGGDGIYSVSAIWDEYETMAREQGWRDSMTPRQLSAKLTKLGYDRPRPYQGRMTRYLFIPKNVDRAVST